MSAIHNHLAMAANAYVPLAATQQTASAAPVLGAGTNASSSAVASAMAGASSAATGSTSSTSSTSTDNSDITSNDFLSLLVSELQNQDPTQPTDPDQYVQQLVGVNSLQQLISINQELA